ncbi:MAG: DUF4340 domain-containing protein [Phycisphaerales bacterium]|jgi:hypothetical protein|nr:DUF4340 domain-containing protein [Phycisphaerales bacterium]
MREVVQSRSLVILLCVAAALVAIDSAVRFRARGDDAPGDRSSSVHEIASAGVDNAERIVVAKGDQQFVFEKHSGSWRQVQPFACRVAPRAIKHLIDTASSLRSLGPVASETSAEVLGLAKAAAIVSFESPGERTEFALGRAMLGDRAFASVDGGEAIVVDRSLHRLLVDGDMRQWRDRRLFPGAAIEARRLERRAGDDYLSLERQEGRWMMLSPVRTRADNAVVGEWIVELAGAHRGQFVMEFPDDLAPFGLDDPVLSIAVEDGDGVAEELRIGNRVAAGTQDRYAMMVSQPVVFRMSAADLTGLFPMSEMLIDVSGSGVAASDIKGVRVRSNGEERLLQRDLDRWIGDEGRLAPREAVAALLNWLLESQPASVAIAPWPSGQEAAIVIFEGYDGRPLDTVRIARSDDGQWLLENGDGVLRQHESSAGEVLLPFITAP